MATKKVLTSLSALKDVSFLQPQPVVKVGEDKPNDENKVSVDQTAPISNSDTFTTPIDPIPVNTLTNNTLHVSEGEVVHFVPSNPTFSEPQVNEQSAVNTVERKEHKPKEKKKDSSGKWGNTYLNIFKSSNGQPQVFSNFSQIPISDKYTMFIDGYYLYSICQRHRMRVKYSALTGRGGNMADNLWYYIISFNENRKIFTFYVNYILKNPGIKSFYENVPVPTELSEKHDAQEFSSFVINKTSEVIVPRMTVDMLSLLVNPDEKTSSITDIVLLSNIAGLVPAVNFLQENDIRVHLGLSDSIPVPSNLIDSVSSVFPVKTYFEHTNSILTA